ncbi:hypothetical protein CLF_110562 [Clonorchis sinensis]|uniref:Uncharacterized protein n=1 Tax=Clonorchis sinensis TaxID=79923 RepID=G7YTN5_CLOSI|nr:hypothetical protein CLF_110562 [Clonorchis sinensis]
MAVRVAYIFKEQISTLVPIPHLASCETGPKTRKHYFGHLEGYVLRLTTIKNSMYGLLWFIKDTSLVVACEIQGGPEWTSKTVNLSKSFETLLRNDLCFVHLGDQPRELFDSTLYRREKTERRSPVHELAMNRESSSPVNPVAFVTAVPQKGTSQGLVTVTDTAELKKSNERPSAGSETAMTLSNPTEPAPVEAGSGLEAEEEVVTQSMPPTEVVNTVVTVTTNPDGSLKRTTRKTTRTMVTTTRVRRIATKSSAVGDGSAEEPTIPLPTECTETTTQPQVITLIGAPQDEGDDRVSQATFTFMRPTTRTEVLVTEEEHDIDQLDAEVAKYLGSLSDSSSPEKSPGEQKSHTKTTVRKTVTASAATATFVSKGPSKTGILPRIFDPNKWAWEYEGTPPVVYPSFPRSDGTCIQQNNFYFMSEIQNLCYVLRNKNIRWTETRGMRLPEETQEGRNRSWTVDQISATLSIRFSQGTQVNLSSMTVYDCRQMNVLHKGRLMFQLVRYSRKFVHDSTASTELVYMKAEIAEISLGYAPATRQLGPQRTSFFVVSLVVCKCRSKI